MSNKLLFKMTPGQFMPVTDAVNEAGGSAYTLEPKHALLQFIMTGTFNETFYKDAKAILNDLLNVLNKIDDEFIEKAAIYSRNFGKMKDMPALLSVYLGIKGSKNAELVFKTVIDNGRMLRNFFQMWKSGVLGRKNFRRCVKRWIREWFSNASDQKLINAYIGKSPTMKQMFRLVPPEKDDERMMVLNKYLKGEKAYLDEFTKMPKSFARYVALKDLYNNRVCEITPFLMGESYKDALPFVLMKNLKLTVEDWRHYVKIMPINALRINLSNMARKKVFECEETTKFIADRLRDPKAVAYMLPYQLYSAYRYLDTNVPGMINRALQDSVTMAFKNIEIDAKNIVIGVDVSGSMTSSITGDRGKVTSVIQCNEVAALIACGYMHKMYNNHDVKIKIIPFADKHITVKLDPLDTITTNARLLAKSGGGGTDCSIPFKVVNYEEIPVDLMIVLSDNESWIENGNFNVASNSVPHQTMAAMEWLNIKKRNPRAKLVNINLQPYDSVQVPNVHGILNIGGFSDEIFGRINEFFKGDGTGNRDWVKMVDDINVNDYVENFAIVGNNVEDEGS